MSKGWIGFCSLDRKLLIFKWMLCMSKLLRYCAEDKKPRILKA